MGRSKEIPSEWSVDDRGDFANSQPEAVNHAIAMLTAGHAEPGVKAVLREMFNFGQRRANEIVNAARACLIQTREEEMPELRKRYRDMTVLTWCESMKYKEFGPATSCLRILTAMDGVNEPTKLDVTSTAGVVVLDGANRAKTLEEWMEAAEDDDPPEKPSMDHLQ